MDKLFPFLIGHRTQIIGILVALIQAAGAGGMISPEHAGQATDVLGPLALATFAAKVQRVAGAAG